MRPRIGIEKLGAYPGSLVLPMRALFEARGHDYTQIRDVMMIDERSVNPGWEDPVTMVVAPLSLLLVAAIACLFPAWRASQADPAVALHHD